MPKTSKTAEELDADLKAKYPEHAKLYAVKSHSQAIGDFLNWLQNDREPRVILKPHDADIVDENGDIKNYDPDWCRVEKLLAEYFGIDQKKIAAEKDAMVEHMRTLNEKGKHDT